MNFYCRHIGDYAKDTPHLSILEHGAYALLLDFYYSTERGLPGDLDMLFRICRAVTKSEQQAVRSVADQFFRLDLDGLRHNKRCDLEIKRASARGTSDEERIENERARRRRHLEERAQLFELLRKFNAHMPFNTPTAELRERVYKLTESRDNPVATPVHSPVQSAVQSAVASPVTKKESPVPSPVTSDASWTATKTPVTSNQEEFNTSLSKPSASPQVLDCPHEQIRELYRKHLPMLRQPRLWDGPRAELLRARWRYCSKPNGIGKGYRTVEEGLKFWEQFFAYVAESKKLTEGMPYDDGTRWKPDLPWLLKPENFAKVIEGKYH